MSLATDTDDETCPRCGSDLELSGTVGMDGRFKDYCTGCSYIRDSEERADD